MWTPEERGMMIQSSDESLRYRHYVKRSEFEEVLQVLKMIRPIVWEDIKRGHGLFSDLELAAIDGAIAKAKS